VKIASFESCLQIFDAIYESFRFDEIWGNASKKENLPDPFLFDFKTWQYVSTKKNIISAFFFISFSAFFLVFLSQYANHKFY
jgi:hypothetical protein